MRKVIQIILLSITTFSCLGQNAKRPEPNFYKNLLTQEILDKKQFSEFRDSLYTKYQDSINGMPNITLRFMKLEISNDSIIQPFNYDVRVGNKYIFRADKYDKIGMSITPRLFQTIYGDSVQIGGVQSKPTLINLWFVHCPGCIQEMPALNCLQEKYADRVNFVALTFDNEKDVLTFLQKRDFKFKQIADVEYFIKQIGSKPYPENIFIDKNGIIRYIEGGLGEATDFDRVLKYFESIIKELL
jgi:thiol-disulfide isomerase/thioredoxin